MTLYQLLLENESDPEPGREAYRPLPGSWLYSRFVQAAVEAKRNHPGS